MAIVYGALISNLSDVKTKLEPCNEGCMQFKLASDDSLIPNTGIWPFELHNGQTKSEIEDTCRNFGGHACDALPGANCKAVTKDVCRSESALDNVRNPLRQAKTKYAFLF